MSGRLLHSPADVLAVTLINLEVATDPGDDDAWPCYCIDFPDRPDNAVFVKDDTGEQKARPMVGGRIEYYGAQVMVRAGDPVRGYDKANEIAQAIDAIDYVNVLVDGTLYTIQTVNPQPVLPLGRESPTSTRRLFSINTLLTMGPTP